MNEDIGDAYYEGITQIANSKRIIDAAEPDTFNHEMLKPNEIKRVLLADDLFWQKVDEEIEGG